MHDTELDLGLRVDGLDGFRKALESVHAGDEDVRDPAVLQLRHDLQPELRAFSLRHPEAEHFLDAGEVDADDEINGLITDVRPVSDFHLERVEGEDGGGHPTGDSA